MTVLIIMLVIFYSALIIAYRETVAAWVVVLIAWAVMFSPLYCCVKIVKCFYNNFLC